MSRVHRHEVLIIEDDTDLGAILKEIAEQDEFRARIATDGAAALRILEESANLPCIIFLDLQMPGMDGHRFLDLKEKNPEWNSIPVVVMSAGRHEHSLERRDHVVGSIAKPFELTKFIDRLATHCDAPAP